MKYLSLLSIVMLVHRAPIPETAKGDKYEIHVNELAKELEQDVPKSGMIKTLMKKTFLR